MVVFMKMFVYNFVNCKKIWTTKFKHLKLNFTQYPEIYKTPSISGNKFL